MEKARTNWGAADLIDGGKKEPPKQRDRGSFETQQAAIARAQAKRERKAKRNAG